MLEIKLKNIWDKIGIAISSLCFLHCLSVPLLILFFPAFKEYFLEGFTHKLFGSLVVVSAYLSFWPNFKIHKQKIVLILGSVGVALVVGAIFMGEFYENHTLEHIITLMGSAMMIFTHIKNIKCAHAACSHH